MDHNNLTDLEFEQFRKFIYDKAGISLSSAKKPLVWGRLNKRLLIHSCTSFHEYFKLIHSEQHADELQLAIDLLTTNETFFFREQEHFEYLGREILAKEHFPHFSLWSAACSTGEEPYSLAMTLSEYLGVSGWNMLASDISTRVLEKARTGLYPIERSQTIPNNYLKKYCLKGQHEYDGSFLIEKKLRDRIRFCQINLNTHLPNVGHYNVIFLRNVMIYFDFKTKQQVLERVCRALKPGGFLFVSHSESLAGLTDSLKMIRPSIYRHG